MDGFVQLFIFSVVMLLGSYGAGSAPLFMPMSEEKLQLVSVLGAGLLVGVALAVIIPEGVQTLIKSYTDKSHSTLLGNAESVVGPSGVATGNDANAAGGGETANAAALHSEVHDHGHQMEGMDHNMGVALVLGFIFMMLIDQLASSHAGSNKNGADVEATSPSSSGGTRRRGGTVNWTTTLGLVVHAAADGIALGAAATTNQLDVELIVFLAIMLHKAPAAFGLVTFLLHEGLDRNRARKHLLIFSLSAPTLAVFTYIVLAMSGSSGGDGKLDTLHATGVAMLFSAGTFLYVATVHVLPEVTNVGGGGHSHFSKCELFLFVVGALMPLLLTLGHHH